MMKTNLIFIAFFFLMRSLIGQELVSKKGEPVLPEAGDWAIQVDAVPFLNYIGNVFSNAGTNTVSAQVPEAYPFSIAGKYFVSENLAYRAKATVNFSSVITHNFVIRDGQVAPIDPNETVRDSRKSRDNTVFLGAGIEKRKGKTRLQGYYGGELLILYSGGVRNTYTYGNQFSADNTNPTSTVDFNTGMSALTSSRIVSSRGGAIFGIGARGFLGAEYFLLPKTIYWPGVWMGAYVSVKR